MCCGLMSVARAADFPIWDKSQPWELSKNAAWQGDGKELELRVNVTPEQAQASNRNKMILDVEKIRGKVIHFSGEAKGINISKPDQTWLGFKFMCTYKVKGGRMSYPAAADGLHGSFDWRPFDLFVAFPEDLEHAYFSIGLQASSGEALFRNVTMIEESPYESPVDLPADYQCVYSESLKKTPMLRGVMSPVTSDATGKDLEEIAAWNGNLIRWQIGLSSWDPQTRKILTDQKRYDDWISERIAELDLLIPEMRRLGLKIVLDIHTPPGGRLEHLKIGQIDGRILNGDERSNFSMFFSDGYLNSFLDLWRKLAAHYKNEPVVFAYDLYNEPAQYGMVKNNYLEIQYLAAQEIRKIDPEKPIVIAANQLNAPESFQYLEPLPFKNLIYQVHMYRPESYTHCRVGWKPEKINAHKLPVYPGTLDGCRFDKEQLRRILQPVRNFQQRHGAIIYVGEFSVLRWMPGGAQYLDDLISIFEEYNWMWSYHAFREYHGWSVEHSDDPAIQEPVFETMRKSVLLKYLHQNKDNPKTLR